MSKKVMIIGASTRPERMGKPLIKWLATRLYKSNADIEHSIVDLEELGLPFLDEPNPPMQGNYQKSHTLSWAKQVSDADGFIIVTPEYNAGYPAPLKNALDFLYAEWDNKPVAFIGYGAGPATNAVKQLREVTERLKMQNVEATVSIPQIWQAFDDEGSVISDKIQGSLDDLVNELNSKLNDTEAQ